MAGEKGGIIATGATPQVALSVGTHTIYLEVTDDDGAEVVDTVVITVSEGAISAPVVDWNTLSDIVYDPTQDDPTNEYLETAAALLETELEGITGRDWIITEVEAGVDLPAAPYIELKVDPNLAQLNDWDTEAFQLLSQSFGGRRAGLLRRVRLPRLLSPSAPIP